MPVPGIFSTHKRFRRFGGENPGASQDDSTGLIHRRHEFYGKGGFRFPVTGRVGAGEWMILADGGPKIKNAMSANGKVAMPVCRLPASRPWHGNILHGRVAESRQKCRFKRRNSPATWNKSAASREREYWRMLIAG
jgi:hypothetical protein